jgi:hypothetical protein
MIILACPQHLFRFPRSEIDSSFQPVMVGFLQVLSVTGQFFHYPVDQLKTLLSAVG